MSSALAGGLNLRNPTAEESPLMYVSHQLLTAHHDEILRQAASRRRALQTRATARAAARRSAQSHRRPRALRLGRLLGQA